MGAKPVAADRDLALVGYVGRHPGDELQAVCPLELGAVVAVPVANPPPALQKGEALKGQHRLIPPKIKTGEVPFRGHPPFAFE